MFESRVHDLHMVRIGYRMVVRIRQSKQNSMRRALTHICYRPFAAQKQSLVIPYARVDSSRDRVLIRYRLSLLSTRISLTSILVVT